jgi:hypothetical protein
MSEVVRAGGDASGTGMLAEGRAGGDFFELARVVVVGFRRGRRRYLGLIALSWRVTERRF